MGLGSVPVQHEVNMSSKIMGYDCCGDRYACNTTERCPCGCELCYCIDCYGRHCIEIVEKIFKNDKEKAQDLLNDSR